MRNTSLYIIAELSANHNGSLKRAKESIHAASEAGTDAIKLQTYLPDTITIDCDNDYFKIKGTQWAGKTLYDLYKEAYTPWEWHEELFELAKSLGLTAFSTPFDASAVDFLEKLNVPYHKVASFELIDTPLLKKIGSTKKPVLMSTGMASFDEISEAFAALKNAGCPEITLLKCTSAYPAEPKDANLITIRDMQNKFGCRVGISDHTLGIAVSVAAVALGASVIEKHFTLSRSESGPDSSFSLEPEEFKSMVKAAHATKAAIGGISYGSTKNEEICKVYRRSLFVVKDIKKGERFTPENIRSIRPGNGISPNNWDRVMQSNASYDIFTGTPLGESMIACYQRSCNKSGRSVGITCI